MARPTIQRIRATLKKAREHIEAIIAVPTRPPDSERPAVGLAFASLVRLLNLLTAIEVVADKGLISEINALGRVIVEATYNLFWIYGVREKQSTHKEQDDRAQELIDGSVFDAEKVAKLWAKHKYMSTVEADKVIAKANEVRERRNLKPTEKFEVKNIPARLRDAMGPAGEENYDLVYRTMCFDAHPSIQGMVWAVDGQSQLTFERNLAMIELATALCISTACRLLGRNSEGQSIDAELKAMMGIAYLRRAPCG